MLTAMASGFASLVATRFLFGVGEAGAWPSVARAFSRWIPRTERGTAQGILFCGAHVAGGVTPMLVLAMVPFMDWRTVFMVFGLLGVMWALAWHRWFRDEPADHPGVNAEELSRIAADRAPACDHQMGWAYWKRLLGHRNMLPLCLMYFPNSFAFYFCITWLPTYLKEKHDFDALSLGFFAGLPLLLSVLGDLFGGITTDAMTRRFGLRIGRSGVGAVAYVLAGVAMIMAGFVTHPILAALLIALALGASMFTLGASWSTCLDIGGGHAGVVSAAMNTSGQIGSVLSPLLVAFLLGQLGDWNAPLLVMGGLFIAGAVCWGFIDPNKRIFG
jgi:MFS family permease